MREIPTSKFLGTAAARGIGVEPQWAKDWPRDLSFVGSRVEPRYWITPQRIAEQEHFIQSLLEAIGPFKSVFLWPRSPSWVDDLHEDHALWRLVTHRLGPLKDAEGAVEFEHEDNDLLIGLLTCTMSFGWSWPNDLFLLTDRFDVVLKTDHHDAVWADFPDQARCDRIVQAMADRDFPLPASPPDSTFRPCSWMNPPDPS